MKPIPLLLKRGGDNALTSTPTNALAKAILEGAPGWVPRRELTGAATFLLDADGRWFQYRLLKSTEKMPKLFVETHRSKQKVHGWVPALQGWWYTALRTALKAKDPNEELAPGIYVLMEDGDGYAVMRAAAAEICEPLAGHPLNFKMLTSFFKESMPNLGWAGIVWWGPNGEMLRLGVSDFR